MGEEYKKGATHTRLLFEKLQPFGWAQVISQDEDVECSKCDKLKNGKRRTHGVDLFATIDCPYLNKTRGIIIDGKRYAIDSCTEKGILKFLQDLRDTVECIDASLFDLQQKYPMDPDVIVDTGILAIHAHNASDEDELTKITSKIKYHLRSEQNIMLLLMTNKHLNRLATIGNFCKANEVEFFYNLPTGLVAQKTLIPESLMSDIIPMRYRPKGDNCEPRVGLFYFGSMEMSDVSFVLPVMKYFQFESHSSMKVFASCKAIEIENLNVALQKKDASNVFAERPITIEQLDEVKYNS